MKTQERRMQAINELVRITKPNGKIMIYVWAKEQEKFKHEKGNNVMVPWNLQEKYRKCHHEQENFIDF